MEKVKFGDSFAEIDDLANKVLSGEKVATSSLLIYHERGLKIKSTVGDYFSVLNSLDKEVAIVRIEKIEIIKFGNIVLIFGYFSCNGSVLSHKLIRAS